MQTIPKICRKVGYKRRVVMANYQPCNIHSPWYNTCMNNLYPIIIEKSEYGYYAECPFIQGAYAQGDTEDEVSNNLAEVIKMTLEDMKERGESILYA